ncbi:pilus assembly protein TadG-related protein [Arthrobacter cryoconiti]|uniref:Pilus assembly protein TadG-related protein n=1 Tax=Arthrobacter cryoconiti TaxID=748907 RepID=A0ABV8R5F6_9MICC|nr:pilus assembly protein TadG-related protein [Arthrobacter cryoconiti]MCC9069357.1 pilus assembly protein TadG-related protein [Arthrobacter cryoconiti]
MPTLTTPIENKERGSATMFFIVLFVGLLLAIGLVVDGGAKTAGFQEARAVAESAARAAAGSIDGNSVAGGTPLVNPYAAQAAAESYISASGLSGGATVSGTTVTVTVTKTSPTIFLSAIGIRSLNSTATATAQLLKQ